MRAEIILRDYLHWPRRSGPVLFHYISARNTIVAFSARSPHPYIGYCRLWRQHAEPALALAVSPPMRRKGHGLRIIHEAHRLWPDAVAYVKYENKASFRLFMRGLWMPQWDTDHDRWRFTKKEKW